MDSSNEAGEMNDIYVDSFGVDHEDDMDQSEEEDDDAREAAVRAEADNPNWNIVQEPDPMITNSWQTLNAENQEVEGARFFRDQLFDSLDELKVQLTEYSMVMKKPYRTMKASQEWYTVACARKDSCGCTWRLSARRLDQTIGMWRVVSYRGPHAQNCVGEVMQLDNRNVTSNFIRGEIIGFIRQDQDTKPSFIIEHLKKRYGVCVSYMKAWKAKQKAIAEIFGDWDQSYLELPKYMAALQSKNLGTVVEWCKMNGPDSNEKTFGRVFWAFAPCIAGFENCRPLITIDGTHLYGKYKHTMLIAMGVDANDQIVPLAFAIVESENGDSWAWFMDCIGRRVTQRMGLCVISDRHPGIIKTMEELDRWRKPNAHHRICIRHLKSNVNSTFHDTKLKNMVGWTAYQHENKQFQKGCRAIKEMNEEAWSYLEDIELEKWSLAHDGGLRYGVMTTNLSKCFNGVLKGGRCLPVTSLVRQTFYKVNSYFVFRRGVARARIAQSLPLTEATDTKIGESITVAMSAHVISFDLQNGIFEVIITPRGVLARRSGRSYTVNLRRMTCTCASWKLLKVPCAHVLAVCRDQSISFVPFVDQFLTTQQHWLAYHMSFLPVGEPFDWPEVGGPRLIADLSRIRDVGRTRSRRIRNEMDFGVPGTLRCGLCRQSGHNRSTCPGRASTSRP